MPDLKTELKKLEALKFDDDGETNVITMPTVAAVTEGSVSKRLFDVVLNNPGCTRKRIVKLAESANIGQSSSSSLLVQFTRRGLIRTVDSPSGLTYFCVGTQYVRGYIKQAKKAAKVATPKAATAPVAVAKQDTNVQELLNNMSIVKARALYDELKKIFGG